MSNSESDEDILFEEVRSFISVQRSANRNEITKETSLYHDLGTDGIDAADLLRDFSEKFHVDMTNFNYDRHFGPERDVNFFVLLVYLCLYSCLKLLRNNKMLQELEDAVSDKKAPIKIADLVRAAKSGEWPADLAERPFE